MALSEIGLGESHPATVDRPQPAQVETELREVAPGQFGHVATRGTVVVPERQRIGQLSGEAFGEGPDRGFTMPERPVAHDHNPDS